MNVLTSIKHKLHIGREIPMGKAGETGAKIDTEDKVNLSSGSGEDKNSMSLKDAATTGGVGFAIGLGVGNNGRIKNLENEVSSIKSEKKSDPPMTMEDGKEPPITPRELKALKMIPRKAFRDGFLSEEFSFAGITSGLFGIIPAIALASTVPMGIGIIGICAIIGSTMGGCASGHSEAKKAKEEWLVKFGYNSEAESMVELNRRYPEIWTKMMKKG